MGDLTRRRQRAVASPPATPLPNTIGPTANGGALVRRGVPADDPQERQRFVGRVLDLMLHAETGLLRRSDVEAVAEAVRCVDAVKAMAAFLGLSTIAAEARGIEGRLAGLRSSRAPLSDADRTWLLSSIDRLRLLAVDPHRGPSSGSDALVSVTLAAVERLVSITDDLVSRTLGSGDPRLMEIAMDLHAASRALLLIPLRSLCNRLLVSVQECAALRGAEAAIAIRGDDIAVERLAAEALEAVLPALVLDAVAERGARAPHLTLSLFPDAVIARFGHEGGAPGDGLAAWRSRLESDGGGIDVEGDPASGTLIIVRATRRRPG